MNFVFRYFEPWPAEAYADDKNKLTIPENILQEKQKEFWHYWLSTLVEYSYHIFWVVGFALLHSSRECIVIIINLMFVFSF